MLSRESWNIEKQKLISLLTPFEFNTCVKSAKFFLEILSFDEHDPTEVYRASKFILSKLKSEMTRFIDKGSFFSGSIYFRVYPNFLPSLNAACDLADRNFSSADLEINANNEKINRIGLVCGI